MSFPGLPLAVRALVASMLVAAALVPAGAVRAQAQTLTPEAREQFAAAWRQQPRIDLNVAADGARVVVVKFNDFQCPSCRDAERVYQPVLERFAASHPGAVRYVAKDWPWDATCNFNATRTIPGHEAACASAAAVRMARDRGDEAHRAMVDWLYANQGATRAAVEAAAGRLAGVTDFAGEFALKLPAIQSDIADGGVVGINSTPTYFVNGVRLPPGIVPAEYLELAISLELAEGG